MPVLDTMLRRIRRDGPNPALKETSEWSWPTRSLTGVTVNDQTALSLSSFYRGILLIASTIAGMPLHIFEEDDGGRKTRLKTADTRYLWLRPNPEMTRQSFWERIIADEIRGNAFIWVEKDDSGSPLALWHIERQRVRVGRTRGGVKVYEIDNELPMIDYKQGGEIVHIPNWGEGLVGYDPIKLAAQSISLGLSAEEYAARLFEQGLLTSIVLTSDQVIGDLESERISTRASQIYGGVRKAGKFLVLGSGARAQPLSLDPEKAQMQELRRFQVADYARLLGIPPHLLGDVERSTSWGSGIEEQNRAFVAFGLLPHILRVEEAINDDLLMRELTRRYVKFDANGLMRGNTLQQAQANAVAWGRWKTTNDIRRDDDDEPIEGGDALMQPLNMAPMDAFEGMKLGQGNSRE